MTKNNITFFDASSEKTFEEILFTPRSKQLHEELLQAGFQTLGILGERNANETLFNLVYVSKDPLRSWIGATLLVSEDIKKSSDAVYFTSDFKNHGAVITVSGTANWFENPRYYHCGLLGLSVNQLLVVHQKMSSIYAKRFETEAEPIQSMHNVIKQNEYYFQEGLDQLLEKENQNYLRRNREYFNVRFTLGSIFLMLSLISIGFIVENQTGQSYWIPLFILWIVLYMIVKKTSPSWKRLILKRQCQKKYNALKG